MVVFFTAPLVASFRLPAAWYRPDDPGSQFYIECGAAFAAMLLSGRTATDIVLGGSAFAASPKIGSLAMCCIRHPADFYGCGKPALR